MVESQPSKLLVAGSIPVSRSRELFIGRRARWRNQNLFARDLTVSFEQAAIKVEKAQEFARLQAAVEQAFLPDKAPRFLKQLDRKGIRVRDFDAVLAQRMLEDVVGEAGLDAGQLYAVASRVRPGADARVLPVEARGSRRRAAAQVQEAVSVLLILGDNGCSWKLRARS